MWLVRSCIVLLFLLLLWFKMAAQERMSLLERRISCQIDSASIEQILEKVVTENDLYFSYNPDILPKVKNSLKLVNVTVEELLLLNNIKLKH
jgi:hypothetical protein